MLCLICMGVYIVLCFVLLFLIIAMVFLYGVNNCQKQDKIVINQFQQQQPKEQILRRSVSAVIADSV